MTRHTYVPGLTIALALLFLFAGAQTASAQAGTATLKGTITDENDRPVRDATVTVTNLTTKETKEVPTDNDGNYTLTGLVADRYEVRVDSPRHKRRIIGGILLESGKARTLDVKLSPTGGGGAPSSHAAAGGGARFAICGDYVYFHVHEGSFNESLNGFDGCFQARVHSRVGIEVESGVVFRSQSGGSEHLLWFSGGPVFALSDNDKVTPWVHAQVGFARDTFTSGGSSSGENTYVLKVGGGVNVKVAHGVEWRVVSVDYAPTHFSGSFQHNIEVRSGICFTFGSR